MSDLVLFVASPSDVGPERECLDGVVAELNQLLEATGHTLSLRKWEVFVPGVGSEEAQDQIRVQTGEADITIVIFWKRFGRPTSEADAATVQEFYEAVERSRKDRRRKLLTYFKTASLDYFDDFDQAQKVKDFRHKIGDVVLYQEFKTTPEFERKAREHLGKIMREWDSGQLEAEEISADNAEQNPAVAFALGMRASASGDRQGAEEWLTRAAGKGDVGAMLNLGMELKSDANRRMGAYEWFKAAAEKDDPTAIYNVGLMLKEDAQPDEAAEWLRRAAEMGDVAAMFNLGLVLREQHNHEQAETWLRRGAEGGDPAAMYTLGLLLEEQNQPDGAELWLRRGAEAGDTNAMDKLADVLAVKGHAAEAEHWRQAAYERQSFG